MVATANEELAQAGKTQTEKLQFVDSVPARTRNVTSDGKHVAELRSITSQLRKHPEKWALITNESVGGWNYYGALRDENEGTDGIELRLRRVGTVEATAKRGDNKGKKITKPVYALYARFTHNLPPEETEDTEDDSAE